MEKKLYELLGIKQYRNFVLLCKAKCNKLFKSENYDNYFLRGYSYEDITFLKEQFIIIYNKLYNSYDRNNWCSSFDNILFSGKFCD